MTYNVKAIREERGITQEKLAKEAGVARATISKLEGGKDVVTSTETIRKIANALDCSVQDIFVD